MKRHGDGATGRRGDRVAIAIVLVALSAGVLFADLNSVKAEPNLEKRSRLALDNAHHALRAARSAYDNGESARLPQLIEEVQHSVELAGDSLKETGKNPRRSPKHFKRAEIDTRDLLRRIDTFRDQMSVVDRPMLDELRVKVQKVHDDLLMGIMEGKRK